MNNQKNIAQHSRSHETQNLTPWKNRRTNKNNQLQTTHDLHSLIWHIEKNELR